MARASVPDRRMDTGLQSCHPLVQPLQASTFCTTVAAKISASPCFVRGESGDCLLFESFFPKPKWLLASAAGWAIVCVAIWYGFWRNFGSQFGMGPMAEDKKPVGLAFFVTPDSLWFYLFFLAAIFLFCLFWQIYARDCKWRGWSVWGTAFILIITKYGVDVSVCLNYWQRPFFDKIQLALSGPNKVPVFELYQLLLIFFEIASVAVAVFVVLRFFVSHYVFRWRTAMNDYYFSRWSKLRTVEGASQRIQEDTMNFATYTEDLGVSFVDAIMTLIAFLPVLVELQKYVKVLPLVGEIPYPLVTAAIFWSVFGTVWLWIFGIRLPGLEFKNQRVEAAFRKELVYGEDHANRADPLTVTELFGNVRKNYFRLYFNYLYFNIARNFYAQADNVYAYFIMLPSISAAAFGLGVMQQIITAFSQVSNSFQYLVNSWTDIIKLMSVYKRLRTFEAAIYDQPLPTIDQKFMDNLETDATPAG